MCKFSSKSEGVPFQISFFLGDLTRNDPNCILFSTVNQIKTRNPENSSIFMALVKKKVQREAFDIAI